jgi:tRNA threonylcarbamoyladenosine biosynthesis protein TsaE
VISDFDCPGPDSTRWVGERLGELLQGGDAIGLIGDLGAGKTLLVQGIARGLGVPDEVPVTSPTFTLINDYPGGRLLLHHADLYRIERAAELAEIGFDELIGGTGVIAVEWSDRFAVLPADSLEIRMDILGEDRRTLSASGGGPRSRGLLADWELSLRSA